MILIKKIFSSIIILFIFVSCDRENISPVTDFTLASDTFKGFKFENMEIIDFPYSATIAPDFVVIAQTNDVGNVLSPFLDNPMLDNSFLLSSEFSNIDSAKNYFDNYTVPEDLPLQQFALKVKSNQIWLVKTQSGNFGKILIEKTRIDSINNIPFAEITFKAANL